MIAPPPDTPDAFAWSRWFRAIGFNPLPSDPEKRRPGLARYAGLRDSGVPGERFARWTFDSGCLQIPTGSRWGLAVVDLDGADGREAWSAWTACRPPAPTWAVETPRGGLHLWYAVPRSGPPLPHCAKLWDGGGHRGIEVLGDRNLTFAPPSFRDLDGRRLRYRWLAGRGPSEIARPATLPAWLAEAVRATAAPKVRPADVPKTAPAKSGMPRGAWTTAEVKAAIGDRAQWARSRWGLRIVGDGCNAGGWMKCRAIGREDRSPSASFHRDRGAYSEPYRVYLKFFDIPVALGLFATWQEAADDAARALGLGRRTA